MTGQNKAIYKKTNARILIVDDQIELLESLQLLLDSAGYSADIAMGGKAALALLKKNAYDAALIDLQMPDINGKEILRYATQSNLDMKVVIVSGEASFEKVKACMIEGAFDYVRKPYVPDELLTTLNNALKARKLKLEHDTMQKSLENSEKLHRYIVNNSPDIVYMLDDEGKFSFVNDTLTHVLQHEREELIGRHYSVLVHEDDLKVAHFVFNERRTGERASKNVELRLKCRNASQGIKYFDTYILPIELTSTGMYNSSKELKPGQKFIGTHGVARDISERKEAEKIINFQAYHDLLTNLPNRALFNDRLNQAIAHCRRTNGLLAVMFLDLDRFKTINDTLGHAIGDQLLQSVTDQLKKCLREEDTLSRFGGDEFTLLLPSLQHREDAAVIAGKVLEQLSEPFIINGHELFVSASIGISICPDAGSTMDMLCKKADIAMYYVKENGKSGYQFFNEEMNNEFTSRAALEQDLRKALDENQFFLHFQPKVNSLSGSLVGLEALVRWQHPERGIISPAEFIPIAEETNMIVPLGRWVFEESCKEICQWNERNFPPFVVSINVSAKQLEQADFDDFIIDTMRRYGLAARQIELEITENAIINNKKSVVGKLTRLSRHGVRIAIDDFGTGYCSLSYLQHFPIDTLKIDRSFVDDIREGRSDTCIVNAIISLAQGLKLHLVAEGVETKHQLDYLTGLGCTEVQGHFFSEAVAPEHITTMLTENSRSMRSKLH